MYPMEPPEPKQIDRAHLLYIINYDLRRGEDQMGKVISDQGGPIVYCFKLPWYKRKFILSNIDTYILHEPYWPPSTQLWMVTHNLYIGYGLAKIILQLVQWQEPYYGKQWPALHSALCKSYLEECTVNNIHKKEWNCLQLPQAISSSF